VPAQHVAGQDRLALAGRSLDDPGSGGHPPDPDEQPRDARRDEERDEDDDFKHRFSPNIGLAVAMLPDVGPSWQLRTEFRQFSDA
jgi:hypothetical protein